MMKRCWQWLSTNQMISAFSYGYQLLVPLLFIITLGYYLNIPKLIQLTNVTFAYFGLIIVALITYHRCSSRKIEMAVLAVLMYIVSVSNSQVSISIEYSVFGIINAIVISLYINVVNNIELQQLDKLAIPPMVITYCKQIIRILCITVLTLALANIYHFLNIGSLVDLTYWLIIKLMPLVNTKVSVVVITSLIALVWIQGINSGATINTLLRFIFIVMGAMNLLYDSQFIVTEQFFDMLWMGGSGTSLAIFMCLKVRARMRKRSDELINSAQAAIFFNINEPIIFGLPIVNNRTLLIPFCLVPIVIGIIQYYAMSSGLVPVPTGVIVPWMCPPLLSGLLITGSLKGLILQLFNLVISACIYYPFISQNYQK